VIKRTIVEILFPTQHVMAKSMLYDPEGMLRRSIERGMSLLNLGVVVAAFEDRSPENKAYRLKRICQGLVNHDQVLTCYPREAGASVHYEFPEANDDTQRDD